MGRWSVVVVVLASACGRLQFDDRFDAAPGTTAGDGSSSDGMVTDPCAPGDGVCRISCLASDTDCTGATCGDSTCAGNVGETCAACAECSTRNPVCGNAWCDASEDSDICFADCGPTPWQWDAEASGMLQALNNARTGGTTCPGGGAPQIRGAFVPQAQQSRGAALWAWNLAYQDASTCDAPTGDDWSLTAAGATLPYVAWVSAGNATPQDAVAGWLAQMNQCNSIMDAIYTEIGVGVAYVNASKLYVIILD